VAFASTKTADQAVFTPGNLPAYRAMFVEPSSASRGQ
jgi:hypothetical protein